MQDQEHLSIDGSLYVAPFIAEQIEKFKNNKFLHIYSQIN